MGPFGDLPPSSQELPIRNSWELIFGKLPILLPFFIILN